ncbi:hypothetical protein KKB18_06330, partial [bacterium]|nr:hypothetical protein [bacterium]
MKEAFLKAVLVPSLSQSTKRDLANIFAEFVEHILPLNLIEGFSEKYMTYSALLHYWDIKQLHSATAHYWNENFKVFALLAKRKGCKLIGHEHGCRCFAFLNRVIYNEFKYLDGFVCWGVEDSKWLQGAFKRKDFKMINLGVPYLNHISSQKHMLMWGDKIKILFAASPSGKFMYDLEHLLPERLIYHKDRVFSFLKKLLEIYPALKIYYKPFPGSSHYAPVDEFFSSEMQAGRFIITDKRPVRLFKDVHLVIWDSISTGFAEAIKAQMPTLIFHSSDEYYRATEKGKKIIDSLKEKGMVFYDQESGLNSFKQIIDDPVGFMRNCAEPCQQFQKSIAYPVSRKEFFKKLQKELSVSQ